MSTNNQVLTLGTLLGDYPSTHALKAGAVRSPRLALAFANVNVPNTAFKDVSSDCFRGDSPWTSSSTR